MKTVSTDVVQTRQHIEGEDFFVEKLGSGPYPWWWSLSAEFGCDEAEEGEATKEEAIESALSWIKRRHLFQ